MSATTPRAPTIEPITSDVERGGVPYCAYSALSFAISARVDEALGKLTLEQVNTALRTYIKAESFVSAVAGDFKP